MREIEEERLARLREKILQEEARKEEERRIRQRKLDEADSLLTHAEETLDSRRLLTSPAQCIPLSSNTGCSVSQLS